MVIQKNTHVTAVWGFEPFFLLYRFTFRDVENMRFVLEFSKTVLTNTKAFRRELHIKKQNEILLDVTRILFANLGEQAPRVCLSSVSQQSALFLLQLVF